MSNLEHLVENTLCSMDRYANMSYDEIITTIQNDVNYDRSGITAEQCFEICQYIYYTYCQDEVITNEQ